MVVELGMVDSEDLAYPSDSQLLLALCLCLVQLHPVVVVVVAFAWAWAEEANVNIDLAVLWHPAAATSVSQAPSPRQSELLRGRVGNQSRSFVSLDMHHVFYYILLTIHHQSLTDLCADFGTQPRH